MSLVTAQGSYLLDMIFCKTPLSLQFSNEQLLKTKFCGKFQLLNVMN